MLAHKQDLAGLVGPHFDFAIENQLAVYAVNVNEPAARGERDLELAFAVARHDLLGALMIEAGEQNPGPGLRHTVGAHDLALDPGLVQEGDLYRRPNIS